jgi:hypothetical protein
LIAKEAEAQEAPSIRCKTAAIVLSKVLQFWDGLRKGLISPFKDGQGNWFTMHQFRYFFNTARVPGLKEDSILSHFKTG